MQTIAAIILSVMLLFLFIQLKTILSLGDAAFVTLVGFSLISGFIIYFQNRITKASLTGIEIARAVEDIQASEKAIKELARAVVVVIDSDSGSLKSPYWDSDSFIKALNKLRSLT